MGFRYGLRLEVWGSVVCGILFLVGFGVGLASLESCFYCCYWLVMRVALVLGCIVL